MAICNATDCQLEVFDDNKCILHCSKKTWRQGYHLKFSELREFKAQLIEYIVNNIFAHEKETREINRQKTINYLSNLESSETIVKFVKKQIVNFDEISFPHCEDRESFNYQKLFTKFDATHFRFCSFYFHALEIKNVKVFFDECDFYDSWMIIDYPISELVSYTTYEDCKFHKDVTATSFEGDRLVLKSDLFRDCIFKKKVEFAKIDIECKVFDDHQSVVDETVEIVFVDVNISDRFIFNNRKVKKVTFENCTFNKKFEFKENIVSCLIIQNCKYKKLADFFGSQFEEVTFYKTDFEKVSVFSEVIFNHNLDFKYTKFIGKGIFRDTVIKGKLNLRDTIFDEDANFLDVTSEKGVLKDIQVENRETARVIKNFYDKSNNIIEANKFYALEMKEREKELSKDIFKNPLEWIIFKIHGIASDHSQSWLLALFWMIIITMFSIELSETVQGHLKFFKSSDAFFISMILLVFAGLYAKNNIQHIVLAVIPIYLLYAYTNDDWGLSCFAERLSSFTKFSADEHSIIIVIYKITMAYLIYQFVISVRQNTRRK